ncbi:MAG: DNA repair protein RecN [Bacteroidales bacterium]|nr:DNA repair protein RecN [Bacteroidales bacterium]
MLTSLSISNYALISSLSIEFGKGMTVITGETGAGKSIIMGGLSLILGKRADSSVLFDKSKKCVIEACFDLAGQDIFEFFDTNNLDYQENTILRREIAVSGKSRAFINDTPVNLDVLRDFSSRQIDIHSQHQNLLFLNADFRMSVIDQYAGILPQVADFYSHWETAKTLEKQLDFYREQHQQFIEKQDYLQFVSQELDRANLKENEELELEQKIDFLSHTETIKGNCFQILQLLSEQDGNALDQLRESQGLSSEISSYHPDIEEINNRISSIYIDLKDLSREISSLYEKVEFDPEELEILRQRVDLIYNLEQKHHVSSLEELLQKKCKIDQELESFSEGENKIAETEAQLNQEKQTLKKKAAEISNSRKKAAPALEKKITQAIHSLGMPDGLFSVQFSEHQELQKNGIDNIKFMFSANKGVPPSELEKVASGGEISRLMLAVKSIISDKKVLPTIIFDEIDVGISGEIAGKVACMMKNMAKVRQLLVITHLPQIAAKGHVHYQVYKSVDEGKSYSKIRKLEQGDRVEEIAKMMSGEKVGPSTLQAAQELIEQ